MNNVPEGVFAIMRLIENDAKQLGGDGQWFYKDGKIGSATYPKGFVQVPESIGPVICRLKNAYAQAYAFLEGVDAGRRSCKANIAGIEKSGGEGPPPTVSRRVLRVC